MGVLVTPGRLRPVDDIDREVFAVPPVAAVFETRGDHPDIPRFQDEILPVAVVIDPETRPASFQDQPGLVVVVEVFFAGGQEESAIQQGLVVGHRGPFSEGGRSLEENQ